MMNSDFDFLEVYDDVLSKEECGDIIDAFEKVDPLSGRLNYGSGNAGQKIATTLYSDLEHELFDDFNKPVKKALCYALPLYKKKYPFIKTLYTWRWDRYYNIQKYKDGEGYYTLHCEHGNCGADPLRILVWMIYLNDAKCGTEFPYQNKTMDAKAGRLVLWPAGWTHPHKGVTPNRELKYIATGWYSYSEK